MLLYVSVHGEIGPCLKAALDCFCLVSASPPFPNEQLLESAPWNSGKGMEAEWRLLDYRSNQRGGRQKGLVQGAPHLTINFLKAGLGFFCFQVSPAHSRQKRGTESYWLNTWMTSNLELVVSMETKVLSLGGEDPVEEGMATLSSILAWEIPWTEPGGIQSLGSQRVSQT